MSYLTLRDHKSLSALKFFFKSLNCRYFMDYILEARNDGKSYILDIRNDIKSYILETWNDIKSHILETRNIRLKNEIIRLSHSVNEPKMVSNDVFQSLKNNICLERLLGTQKWYSCMSLDSPNWYKYCALEVEKHSVTSGHPTFENGHPAH